jgi:hypothetical protein
MCNEMCNEAKSDDTASQPMRELYWRELSTEQKIERMHMQVRSLLVDRSLLQEKVDMLMEHSHDTGGKPTVAAIGMNFYGNRAHRGDDGEDYYF